MLRIRGEEEIFLSIATLFELQGQSWLEKWSGLIYFIFDKKKATLRFIVNRESNGEFECKLAPRIKPMGGNAYRLKALTGKSIHAKRFKIRFNRQENALLFEKMVANFSYISYIKYINPINSAKEDIAIYAFNKLSNPLPQKKTAKCYCGYNKGNRKGPFCPLCLNSPNITPSRSWIKKRNAKKETAQFKFNSNARMRSKAVLWNINKRGDIATTASKGPIVPIARFALNNMPAQQQPCPGDKIFSLCHCNTRLTYLSRRKGDWQCDCCCKTFSKWIKPYGCNNARKCLYHQVTKERYLSCSDCLKFQVSANDDLKTDNHDQDSFFNRKLRAQLSVIS